MESWIIVLCVLTFSKMVCGEISSNNYDNHTLILLYPESEKHLEAINHLGDSNKLDILKNSRSFNDSTDILVPPHKMLLLEEFAKAKGMRHEIKSQYGRSFENVHRESRRRNYRSFSVFEYHSYQAIQEYIEMLAKKHPDLVKLQTLGASYQGRRMKLVKISSNSNAGNPIIFIDAGVHAREWVAPAMALYLIHRLVSDAATRKKDLTGVDWYILPVVNPDGYEYTRSSKVHRLWRKTMSKVQGTNCYGVDGNRNYGFKWGVSGVSKNPCDGETYAGSKPFSEVETKMVRNVLLENKNRIKLYVSLHSYGNYLVYPWGYTGNILPVEWEKLDSLARIVSRAVEGAGGQPFTVMSAGKWYAAAGGSDDFAFGAVGIPYAYTMELTKGYEFTYPEHLLRAILPQYYEGFMAFAAQIKGEFPTADLRQFSGE